MSPTNPRCTASGLSAINVRSDGVPGLPQYGAFTAAGVAPCAEHATEAAAPSDSAARPAAVRDANGVTALREENAVAAEAARVNALRNILR